jgi:DNA-binding XRE family transcriptional regulator
MRRNLIDRRKELNLSQAALARLAGVGQTTITKVETEALGGSVGLWDRLETILGMPQQWLRKVEGAAKAAGRNV